MDSTASVSVSASDSSEPVVSSRKSTDDSDDEEDEDDDIVAANTAGPKETNRTGRLLLFRVNDEEDGAEEVQRVEMNAILDAKW